MKDILYTGEILTRKTLPNRKLFLFEENFVYDPLMNYCPLEGVIITDKNGRTIYFPNIEYVSTQEECSDLVQIQLLWISKFFFYIFDEISLNIVS
jgi:hypothetical protein